MHALNTNNCCIYYCSLYFFSIEIFQEIASFTGYSMCKILNARARWVQHPLFIDVPRTTQAYQEPPGLHWLILRWSFRSGDNYHQTNTRICLKSCYTSLCPRHSLVYLRKSSKVFKPTPGQYVQSKLLTYFSICQALGFTLIFFHFYATPCCDQVLFLTSLGNNFFLASEVGGQG